MPHFEYPDSLPDYPHSPQSDWYGYMENTDTCLYEPNFIDVFTGESSHHVALADSVNHFGYPQHGVESTASRKIFAFPTDLNGDRQREWTRKPLDHWHGDDIMYWIISVAKDHGYEYEKIHMQAFNLDGLALGNMTETEFIARSPDFGKTLFLSLQNLTGRYFCDRTSPLPTFMGVFRSDLEKAPMLAMKEDTRSFMDLNVEHNMHRASIIRDLNDAREEVTDNAIIPVPQVPVKRLPGRPRGTRTKKKPEKRCGRLWEFIRDLLLNRDYCPSLICWDDHDNGVFRFVHSEKVARLWGTIKENPKMTYEKLSRAMRYYYKSKVLQPVLGRRLVYKFGPTATGWRTPNPNFRLSE